jgi:hypothetical protein
LTQTRCSNNSKGHQHPIARAAFHQKIKS